MPDNLNITQPGDRQMINVHEPYELRDWAIYFSVSQDKILEAVRSVGPMVEDVRRHLRK